MGELGAIRRYSYWSDRRVKDIATDNNINLDRKWLPGATASALGLFQTQIAQNKTAIQRHEIATRIEEAIGQVAVEDFVTPPAAKFAKGRGEITFAVYKRWTRKKKRDRPEAVILHTRTRASDGTRVEICFFGSIENCVDYRPSSNDEVAMWSSSSTWSIEEFIANRGTKQDSIYDDDESIAVEILRVLNNEGMIGKYVPKRITAAEWFAEIYHDVVLDKERWNLEPGMDIPQPVDRIVVGAPLWVRSNSN